jgi:hypothetical protein
MQAAWYNSISICILTPRASGLDREVRQAADSRSLRFDNYVRMHDFVRRSINVSFRRFLGDVLRELMKRLCDALPATLGSYLRDALQKGSANIVACRSVPRALACGLFSLLAPFCLVVPTAFSCGPFFIFKIMW